jgi:RNA polymerase sigma-70 factor (ECF subfamily)
MDDSATVSPADDAERHSAGPWFNTTHWSVILAAGGDVHPAASEALSRLAQSYRPAILGFAHSLGFQPADAEDLTQGFFLHFVRNNLAGKVERRQATRFRSFLLRAFRNFLADERDRWLARKRGGDHAFVPLEEWLEAEGEQRDCSPSAPSAHAFDREWASALVGQTLDRLEGEYAARGRRNVFDRLHGYLLAPDEAPPYARLSTDLVVTEEALRKEVSRMRRRYGELFREEVANTVDSPTEVAEEIRHLLAALVRDR